MMQFKEFDWLSGHGIWAILPCPTNMASVYMNFWGRFYCHFSPVFHDFGFFFKQLFHSRLLDMRWLWLSIISYPTRALANYSLNSLSLFWLVESVQWICEISLRDVMSSDYTIIMSRVRVIMSRSRALCCLPSVKKRKEDFYFSRAMHNETFIRFGFSDIQNDQGLGKGLSASAFGFGW